MDYILLYKLFLSLILGSFIGIERQIHHLNLEGARIYYLGLRTFALTSVLGTIAGFIYVQIPLLFFLITLALLLLVVIHYFLDSQKTKDFGITTEISLIFTYTIGVLIATNLLPLQITIGITVILLLLLSQKERLKNYVKRIEEEELRQFISFCVIALVILPILPNKSFVFSEVPNLLAVFQSLGINPELIRNIQLINPFRLWLFVALITGVEVFGYILEKLVGRNKGWFAASFAGGIISSTATTQSLAQQSKHTKYPNFLISSSILATLASFVQLSLLILPLNPKLFAQVLPIFLIMITTSAAIATLLIKRGNHVQDFDQKISRGKLFYLAPAIRFALLFLFINLVSSIALVNLGQPAFLLFNAIGAIPGLDAVIINISDASGKIASYTLGLWAIMLAVTVNILVKIFLSFFFGTKEFAIKFTLSSALIVLGGFLGLLFTIK